MRDSQESNPFNSPQTRAQEPPAATGDPRLQVPGPIVVVSVIVGVTTGVGLAYVLPLLWQYWSRAGS